MELCQRKLLEGEAIILLPILIEKSGHNNATIRQTYHEIIIDISKVYSPKNLGAHVINGLLVTKNNRTKVECLEILTQLFNMYKVEITKQQHVRQITEFVKNAQNDVRNAAVTCLAEIYRQIGENIWNVLGNKIGDKVKDLLIQKFKTIQVEEEEEDEEEFEEKEQVEEYLEEDFSQNYHEYNQQYQQEMIQQNQRQQQLQFQQQGMQQQEYQQNQRQKGRNVPPPQVQQYNPNNQIQQAQFNQKGQLQSFEQFEGQIQNKYPENIEQSNHNYRATVDVQQLTITNTEVDQALLKLLRGDLSEKVDCLVQLSNMVREEKYQNELQSKVDTMLIIMAEVTSSIFNEEELPIRFTKYFLQVVQQITAQKWLLTNAKTSSIYTLTEELLSKLLLEDIIQNNKEEGEQLLKTCNGAMLRLLENAAPTRTFVALIQLLKTYRNDQSNLSKLVIKCLLKLAKVIPQLIDQINIEQILLEMHLYMLEIRDPTVDEIGTRTIKTIINELCKLLGERIWEYYTSVNKHAQNDLHLKRWIQMLLKSQQTGGSGSSMNIQHLKNLLNKLQQEEDQEETLKKLYEFQQNNQQISVLQFVKSLTPQLTQTLEQAFQQFQNQEYYQSSQNTQSEQQEDHQFNNIRQMYGEFNQQVPVENQQQLQKLAQLKDRLRNMRKTNQD